MLLACSSMHANLPFLLFFSKHTPPPFSALPSPAGAEQANQPWLLAVADSPLDSTARCTIKWLPGLASALSPALGSLHPCLVHLTFPLSWDWPDGTETLPRPFSKHCNPI